jgi:hypothetical protein
MAIQEETREEQERRPGTASEDKDPLSMGAVRQREALNAAVSKPERNLQFIHKNIGIIMIVSIQARAALIKFHQCVRQKCDCACCVDDRSVRNLIDHNQPVVLALLDTAWDR